MVVVRRGSVVEARHRVHAVVVRDGAVVESAGTRGSSRSSARRRSRSRRCPRAGARGPGPPGACDRLRLAPPSRPNLTPSAASWPTRRRASASSSAGSRRVARPTRSTTTARASTPACSRSAARTAGARGLPARGAPRPAAMAAAHAETAGVDEDSMPSAIDGCGVVTFALSLELTARAFGRLAELRGGERVLAAMRTNPELVGGAGQADTELMRRCRLGRKGGAEGLMRNRATARRRSQVRGRDPPRDEARAARDLWPDRPSNCPPSSPGCRSERPWRRGRRDCERDVKKSLPIRQQAV